MVGRADRGAGKRVNSRVARAAAPLGSSRGLWNWQQPDTPSPLMQEYAESQAMGAALRRSNVWSAPATAACGQVGPANWQRRPLEQFKSTGLAAAALKAAIGTPLWAVGNPAAPPPAQSGRVGASPGASINVGATAETISAAGARDDASSSVARCTSHRLRLSACPTACLGTRNGANLWPWRASAAHPRQERKRSCCPLNRRSAQAIPRCNVS